MHRQWRHEVWERSLALASYRSARLLIAFCSGMSLALFGPLAPVLAAGELPRLDTDRRPDLVSIRVDEGSSNRDESIAQTEAFAQPESAPVTVLDPRDVSVVPPTTIIQDLEGQAEIRAAAVLPTATFPKLDLPVLKGSVQIVDADENLERLLTQLGIDVESTRTRSVAAVDDLEIVGSLLRELTLNTSIYLVLAGAPLTEAPTSREAEREQPTRASSRGTDPEVVSSAATDGLEAAVELPAVSVPSAWPLVGTITQRYTVGRHRGLDIAAPLGTPVRAAGAGTVTTASRLSHGYGWHIVIDHGQGYTSLYAHLSSFSVAPEQRVTRGDAIGRVGSTGLSTGPHLHFEVAISGRRTDPATYLP